MTTPPPARNPAIRIIDIVVGIVIGLFALLFGFVTVPVLSSVGPDPEFCGSDCDPSGLAAIVIVGIAVEIFAWALSIGFFFVRVVRRRLAFFVPLIGFVVMIAAFYATSAGIAAWADNLGAS